MRAVRVAKAGANARGMTKVHWLTDDEATRCGLNLDDVGDRWIEELDLEKLPALDGCGSCRRVLDGWTPDAPGHTGRAPDSVTLQPSLGSSRRTGSLNHGGRSRTGQRLR